MRFGHALLLSVCRKRLAEAGDDEKEFFYTFEMFDKEQRHILVCRLWHANVFVGARDSATADPALKNRDYHYYIESVESLGQFQYRATKRWEETEEELES